MKLFKRHQEPEVVDTRTEIEKTFEEKGQVIGRKTGKVVQKSVDKIQTVKTKLEEDGTMDKLRRFSDTVDDKIDHVVNRVVKKGKQLSTKRNKQNKPAKDDEELFYE